VVVDGGFPEPTVVEGVSGVVPDDTAAPLGKLSLGSIARRSTPVAIARATITKPRLF
jgi:hypothetical protein